MLAAMDLLEPIFTPDLVERNHPLNHGIVAWWLALPPLDGGRYWYDLCGLSPGTLTNGPTWRGSIRPGGLGAAIEFGGSSQWVQVVNSPVLAFTTESFTVSTWINATSGIFILGTYAGNGWGLSLSSSGIANWFFYGPGGNRDPYPGGFGGGDIRGAWRHLTCVYARDPSGTGMTMRLYVDGVFVGSDGIAGNTSIAGGGPTQLGTYENQVSSLVGSLDDCRIYNRALSAADVAALYDESRRGYPTALRRIWRSLARRPVASWFPTNIKLAPGPPDLVPGQAPRSAAGAFSSWAPTPPLANQPQVMTATKTLNGTPYAYQTPFHNLQASRAPLASDDRDSNYSPGSFWVDKTGDQAYICVDATKAAAVWKQIT